MLNIKKKIKTHLLAFIRHNVETKPTLYGDSYWYAGPNLWEPTVMLALRDLCKPGTVVFDVGGNMGGLTSAMARLVGPKGTVCTFEASPRIIGYLQGNVVAQGHHNVTVYHRAVYSKSNEIITIYDGDHLNDSIYAEQSPTKVGRPVKTLALDDFCDATGFSPDVIKMDIEGAEYDALIGSGLYNHRFEQLPANSYHGRLPARGTLAKRVVHPSRQTLRNLVQPAYTDYEYLYAQCC